MPTPTTFLVNYIPHIITIKDSRLWELNEVWVVSNDVSSVTRRTILSFLSIQNIYTNVKVQSETFSAATVKSLLIRSHMALLSLLILQMM